MSVISSETLRRAFLAHRQFHVFDLRSPTFKYPLSLILVPSSLPRYIGFVLFPYCFRIVSASGSENDRRMIGERYGIDTGLIRGRYENDISRYPTGESDKKLNFFIVILAYYILHSFVLLRPASRAKMAGFPIAILEQLYKENLPPSRMQVD